MASPERVLVTGGAGFIGSHVVDYYRDRDAEVSVLDNRSRSTHLASERDTAAYNWNRIETEWPDVDLVDGDIRNYQDVRRTIEGFEPDAVVHVAGQTAVTASLSAPLLDMKVNVEGTLNVLEAIRESDCDPALVYASTNKVYGENVNRIPIANAPRAFGAYYRDPDYKNGIPESFPVDRTEHTPYGVSKLAADQYVQDYARRGVLDAAVFRMSCIYGPRQFGTEGQGWIAHFAISVMEHEPITIFGDGHQRRDVLYVDDLVNAYDAFLSDPEGTPHVYNIGGGPASTTSVLGCLDVIEDVTGIEPDVTYSDTREGDQDVYVSNIERAISELGWRPTIGFREGIGRFVDWYQSEGQAISEQAKV